MDYDKNILKTHLEKQFLTLIPKSFDAINYYNQLSTSLNKAEKDLVVNKNLSNDDAHECEATCHAIQKVLDGLIDSISSNASLIINNLNYYFDAKPDKKILDAIKDVIKDNKYAILYPHGFNALVCEQLIDGDENNGHLTGEIDKIQHKFIIHFFCQFLNKYLNEN